MRNAYADYNDTYGIVGLLFLNSDGTSSYYNVTTCDFNSETSVYTVTLENGKVYQVKIVSGISEITEVVEEN